MQSDRQLIRDTEAASILGCGRSTLWRWVHENVIPKPIKIGSSSRWYQSEIEAVIVAAANKSRAPQPRLRKRVRPRP
ncbi:helix-turn-helix transcriptional regulator [Jannaschia sp. 2305UL9-9]|uniref:helix-turn-helix transcriptional regulator n=1 Tax=Jannaschia sp. 2305UL9-9 TaxID=3121638 RepID=UPI0035291AE2